MILGKAENIFGAQGVPMSLQNPQYSRDVENETWLWECDPVRGQCLRSSCCHFWPFSQLIFLRCHLPWRPCTQSPPEGPRPHVGNILIFHHVPLSFQLLSLYCLCFYTVKRCQEGTIFKGREDSSQNRFHAEGDPVNKSARWRDRWDRCSGSSQTELFKLMFLHSQRLA